MVFPFLIITVLLVSSCFKKAPTGVGVNLPPFDGVSIGVRGVRPCVMWPLASRWNGLGDSGLARIVSEWIRSGSPFDPSPSPDWVSPEGGIRLMANGVNRRTNGHYQYLLFASTPPPEAQSFPHSPSVILSTGREIIP